MEAPEFLTFYRRVRAGERVTASEGISLAALSLLCVWTEGSNNGKTMGAISEALKVTRGAATTLTDKLVARGMVERTHDKEDRRRVLVVLTEDGRRKRDELLLKM